MGVRTTATKARQPLIDGLRPHAEAAHRRHTRRNQTRVGAYEQTASDAFVAENDGAVIDVKQPLPDLAGYADGEAFAAGDATGRVSRFAPGRDVAFGPKTELALRRLNDLADVQAARVAALLHDEASQVLASAHIALEDVARNVPPQAQARLNDVRQHLHDVEEQLRRISHELHPSIVDDLGAIDAIKFIARAFTRQTSIQLTIDVRLSEPCPATVGAALYRFVHEALANIRSHARASSASIAISREGSRLVCAICDDGVGFDVAARVTFSANRSQGLMLIHARIEALGGTLDIASAPQQGTRLRAIVPLEI